MDEIEFEQTVQQWQEYQDKPWLRFNMTESEYREYEDEYADYLDGTLKCPTTIMDTIREQNKIEQFKHDLRRQAALNKIRDMRRKMKNE